VATEPCNVAAALGEQARAQPHTAALHHPTGLRGGRLTWSSLSYAELDEASDACARGLLEWGLPRGTRTALMVPPGRDFFTLFFALFKAGLVPVLIDPGIGLRPLKSCLGEAAPTAFIGIPRAQLARAVLGWARDSIDRALTVGPGGWPGTMTLDRLLALGQRSSGAVLADTAPDELAAILFTSGSTGVPKGVVYRHRHFVAQVAMLKDRFDIRPGEVDLATFPPFALFDPALGMTTVVPWMDPTRPAKADPRLLVQAIERFGVTNVFGSPALLRVLSLHAEANGLRLDTVRRVLSAGAAVPAATVRRTQSALPDGALVHTPYGATECLPVASISSAELTEEVIARTDDGAGICVGQPVPPNEVAIIRIGDEPIERLGDAGMLPTGETGEIVVHGPTTTDAYWLRESQTRLAKIVDGQGRTWHRMGDVGYMDAEGRLWYCGRKSQRVATPGGTLFPDQVEAVFNAIPGIGRTALVGTGLAPNQRAVLCVELPHGDRSSAARQRIRETVLATAARDPRLSGIRDVLFHRAFPVDIRHNAKIGREKLAKWAGGKLS